jgi:hypothetical protein
LVDGLVVDWLLVSVEDPEVEVLLEFFCFLCFFCFWLVDPEVLWSDVPLPVAPVVELD